MMHIKAMLVGNCWTEVASQQLVVICLVDNKAFVIIELLFANLAVERLVEFLVMSILITLR